MMVRTVRVTMPRPLLLLLLLLLAGCSSQTPYATTVGLLKPGATLEVRVASATVNAYQPSAGQPRRAFTISATALAKQTPPAAPRLRPVARGVIVDAPGPLASLLVRVPDDVNLVIESEQGDVNVTDISGNARIVANRGDVKVMLPGYAQAAVGEGNLSVTMGSTDWPGTLHFSTRSGNIEVWVIAKAAFNVRLHTDDGSLFTDFGLRGTSQGRSETIVGSVNGGGGHGIDVEAATGTIRLLRLTPQP
jgi:Putative adhesin